jgi:hypothetical protein
MKRLIIVVAVAGAAIGIAVTVAVMLPTGPSDAEENERILRALPVYPGAELLQVTQHPYYNCGWPFRRRLGYSTSATYRAPEKATAEQVVQFYIAELGGDWEATRDDIGVVGLDSLPTPAPAATLTSTPVPSATPFSPPIAEPRPVGSIPMASFVKGTARIHVQTESMAIFPGHAPSASEHQFTVVVDAEGTVDRPYCD